MLIQEQKNPMLVALALLGLVLIVVGCFLPAIKDKYTSSDEDSLFETSRFEGDEGFKNGITGSNQLAIYLFIIVACSIYPALTMRGLRGMSLVAFVYTSILVYVLAADEDSGLKIGWYVIYAGILLMFAARQIDIRQSENDPYQKYRTEYMTRLPFGKRGLIDKLGVTPLSADPKKPIWSGSVALSSLTPCGVCVGLISSVLSVRQEPSGDAEKLVQINSERTYDVLGKSADGEWWLIDYGGGRGWISAAYTQVKVGDPDSIPVIQ